MRADSPTGENLYSTDSDSTQLVLNLNLGKLLLVLFKLNWDFDLPNIFKILN